jgi:glycosyltransferase involved in cell wall biosynthesis
MRIGLVTNLYPPIQTGTAHWTRELAQHLSARGHSVVVITCRTDGAASPSVAREHGATVHRLPARRLQTTRLLLGFDEFYIANSAGNRALMQDIVASERLELLHQCGHLLDLTYATPRVAGAAGIPTVCSIHTIIHSPASLVLDACMRLIDRSLVRRFGPARYDTLIALDGQVRAYIERTYRHPRVRTVLVSIDDDVLSRAPASPPAGGPFRILSVGHVTAMRSRVDLVRAVERLHQQGLRVELVIVGKICDQHAQALVRARHLENVVTFTGELPRERVFELAGQSHMEAHWITVPGLGTATLEAMALGLPVMAWTTPGLYDDVPLENGTNLLFAQPGNIEQIAGQIRKLVDDRPLRESIGGAARALVRQHLSWGSALQRLESAYSEAVGRPVRVECASATA